MATQTGKQSLWQQYKTPILLLGGIAIGSLIGVVSPGLGQTLKPVGDIFLNLLFTIVVPLVFVSITCAVGSMANMNRLGKSLGGTVATFLGTGAIAAACVLIWVNLFSPSAGTSIQLGAAEVGEAQTAAQMIVGSLTVSDSLLCPGGRHGHPGFGSGLEVR
nr:cation:dicarboxylase symporter family transporter [uncultured Oscillibacter sp.]